MIKCFDVVSQKVMVIVPLTSYEKGGSGADLVRLLQGFGLRAFGAFVLGLAYSIPEAKKSRTQPHQEQLCTPWNF